jgi:hypothetical protein
MLDIKPTVAHGVTTKRQAGSAMDIVLDSSSLGMITLANGITAMRCLIIGLILMNVGAFAQEAARPSTSNNLYSRPQGSTQTTGKTVHLPKNQRMAKKGKKAPEQSTAVGEYRQ